MTLTTNKVTEELLDRLQDSDPYVRSSAAFALGCLGPEIARPEVVERPLEYLRDPKAFVGPGATWPLRRIGSAALGVERSRTGF